MLLVGHVQFALPPLPTSVQSARRSTIGRHSIARSLCMTWRRAVSLHNMPSCGASTQRVITQFHCTMHVASLGPFAWHGIARFLYTTCCCAVSPHDARCRGVVRSLGMMWRHAVCQHSKVLPLDLPAQRVVCTTWHRKVYELSMKTWRRRVAQSLCTT